MLKQLVIAATAAGALSLAVGSPSFAATWRSCSTFSVESHAGDSVRISNVRVRGTTCSQAKRVARSFYGQTIGSSGATSAAGYGCAYHGSNQVRCGAGADGRGARKIRWRERR